MGPAAMIGVSHELILLLMPTSLPYACARKDSTHPTPTHRKMAATKTSASRTIVTEDYVEALKRRLETLEKKLLPLDRSLPVIPLTNAVKDLEKKLDNLASKEKSGDAQKLWEKTRQLEDTISPEYLQSIKMTEGAKAELLCGQVDQLKQFSDRMEEVRRHPLLSVPFEYIQHTSY